MILYLSNGTLNPPELLMLSETDDSGQMSRRVRRLVDNSISHPTLDCSVYFYVPWFFMIFFRTIFIHVVQ